MAKDDEQSAADRFLKAVKNVLSTPKPSNKDLAKSNPEREDAPDAEREKDKKSG